MLHLGRLALMLDSIKGLSFSTSVINVRNSSALIGDISVSWFMAKERP